MLTVHSVVSGTQKIVCKTAPKNFEASCEFFRKFLYWGMRNG
jgi:hypothetical protein